MGYALFAQRKIVVFGLLNSVQLQQMQRQDEQFKLATQKGNLQQQLSSLAASQSGQLSELYGDLSDAEDSDERESINASIKEKEEEFNQEKDDINRQTYAISLKESAIEMEVKRLDTIVTKYNKELEKIEKAEQQGIDKATPNFAGLG